MSPSSTKLEWSVIEPLCSGSDETRYEELREFRAQTLYEDGRRPIFRRADGIFDDSDPLDSVAHHVTVRAGEHWVACARLVPLEQIQSCEVRGGLGGADFDKHLKSNGVREDDCLIGSRWIVARQHRRTMIAPRIIGAVWAVGRHLRRSHIYASTGTRDDQAALLVRLGGELVSEVEAKTSTDYDDVVQLVHLPLNNPSKQMLRRVIELTALLGLSPSSVPLPQVAVSTKPHQ